MAESSNNVSEHNIHREQDHASIEIRELEDDLVSTINKKLEDTSMLLSKCCIYRVPDKLRAVNKKAYVPQIVSIGPFHHGRKNLRAMEDQKWYYVKSFIHRSPLKLEAYVKAIRELEESARICYAENIKLSSKEFVQMMIVDGCFIIELVERFAKEMRDKDDPIFSKVWMFPHVRRDLILLENQLPFCILERLYSLHAPDQDSWIFLSNIIAFSFFASLMKKVPQMNLNVKGKHILDMLRNCLLPSPNTNLKIFRPLIPVPCATELQQAGIKFKEGEPSDPLDINFNNGVIELLHLSIVDSTETVLRNLIAFEQLHSGCTNHITSYAFLMDNLINSSKDVEVLCDSGILNNCLGNAEDVSLLFNKLCHEVNLEDFYYSEICHQVNKYYGTKRHKWKATLTRDYFNSPWTIISFVAAVMLLICTFIQTGTSLR